MAVDITDGARLAARGAPITLRGQIYRIVLTFEAVELLESDFGGFDLFIEHLRDKKYKKTGYLTVRKGIVAGLIHSKPAQQDIVDFEREIVALLEPHHRYKYVEALWLAIVEAFPPIKVEEQSPKVGAVSPGNGSTTSSQFAGVAAIASSGA